MNVVSLFTGVGGFDLGLERAGHRIVAQCEADEKARAVLRRHWPDVPIHEDVSGLNAEWCGSNGISINGGLGFSGSQERVTDTQSRERSWDTVAARDVDLVCGGFPCQDLSVAGKRAGLAGERSGLFFEAARISDLVLGDGGWVLIENVPGLLSSNGGRDFGVVLATLADLGFHDLAWRVLDSRYLGVPQRRRRVFILARRSRGRRAAEILLEPESGGGNHQASREARARVAAAPSGSLANALDRRQGGPAGDDAQANHLVSDTLRANGATGGRYDKHPLTVAGALTKRYGKGINTTFDDGAMVVTDGSQREPTGRGQGDALLPPTDNGRREAGSGSSDGQDGPVSPPPDTDGVRTPPGIPGRVDDPVTCAYDPKPDGPRYAQMGNAVTVNVAEWIGHRLREFG